MSGPDTRIDGSLAAGRTTLSQNGFSAQARDHARVREAPPVHSIAPSVAPRTHRLLIAAAIVVDLIAIAAAFELSALVRYTPAQLLGAAGRASGVSILFLGALLWVAILSAREAYAPRVLIAVRSQVARVLLAAVPGWILTHLLAFLLKAQVPFESRLAVAISLPACAAALALGRLLVVRPLARSAYLRLCRGPILVVGDTERASRLARHLESRGGGRSVHLCALAGITPENAGSIVAAQGYSEVVIEPDARDLEEVFDIAFACLDARAEVLVVSDHFQVVAGRDVIGEIEGIPAMRFRRADLAGPEVVLKRLIDLVGAVAGLLALAPLLLVIAIAVKATSPGPILFRQVRVGRHGRRFTMLKFRTMTNGNDPRIHHDYLRSYIRDGAPASVDEDGEKIYKLTRDPRVTPVGGWLRALSLDELPQLWNVLEGDMSLVGPRPCLPYEWELYRPWQRRRLDVLPGCTGLWQVTARSLVGFDDMVILDLHYAHHGSIGRDLRLIARTIPAMVRGRGGY